MTELNVIATSFELFFDDANIASVLDQLAHVIPRLVNLKVLRIFGTSVKHPFFPNGMTPPKKKLTFNLRNLKTLCLRLSLAGNPVGDDDEFMAHLVEWNPNLEDINCLDLTEKGMRLLSSMKGLRIATELRVKSHDQIPAMLMMILSGNSQDCIQKVSISAKRLQSKHDENYEVQPLQEGTLQEVVHQLKVSGLPFKVSTNVKGDVMIVTRDSYTVPGSPFINYRQLPHDADSYYDQF
jgi:hypothetical protein